jgi:hypothetical protein
MARSSLTSTSDDLISDSGSVLWSFVRGEQLEFPLVLSFLENALAGYTYEAVVIEAANEAEQTQRPTTVKAGGVQTILNVRVPTFRDEWQSEQAYNKNEVVSYQGKYYGLVAGAGRVNATTPDVDPLWAITTPNTIYLQFMSTLGATYSVQASVGSPTYGFFELRVTESNTSDFQRTWKPARGMVELLFSPTDVVPDAP